MTDTRYDADAADGDEPSMAGTDSPAGERPGAPDGSPGDTDRPGGTEQPGGTAGLAALRRRTTGVLVATQVLGGLGVATAIALAPVLAERVGGSEALAGLGSTSSVIGTALVSLPLATLMAARGRRPGLTLAYLIGAAGGLVTVLGAAVGNFPLLLFGMAAFGAGSSANLQARFAAADLAEPEHRARAISLVVWATTIGAVLGPNIAAPAGHSVSGLGIPAAAGPFLWATVVFLLAAALVHVLLRPDPLLTARALASGTFPPGTDTADRPGTGDKRGSGGSGCAGASGTTEGAGDAGATGSAGSAGDAGREERSLRAGAAAVAASAHARLALVTIAGSHTVMVSIMVMTPVDLGRHGAGIELIGLVISGHILGMYALSPLLGRLADKAGRRSVVLLGVALLACAAALAGTSNGNHAQSAAGLFLLGLGWSAGLVSGSALLTDSVPQPARAAVQGLSDLTMNASAGAGGALAGLVVSQAGYGWLNALAALLLLPVAALALLAGRPVPASAPASRSGPEPEPEPPARPDPPARAQRG